MARKSDNINEDYRADETNIFILTTLRPESRLPAMLFNTQLTAFIYVLSFLYGAIFTIAMYVSLLIQVSSPRNQLYLAPSTRPNFRALGYIPGNIPSNSSPREVLE